MLRVRGRFRDREGVRDRGRFRCSPPGHPSHPTPIGWLRGGQITGWGGRGGVQGWPGPPLLATPATPSTP